jgi:hypothetical protein
MVFDVVELQPLPALINCLQPAACSTKKLSVAAWTTRSLQNTKHAVRDPPKASSVRTSTDSALTCTPHDPVQEPHLLWQTCRVLHPGRGHPTSSYVTSSAQVLQ